MAFKSKSRSSFFLFGLMLLLGILLWVRYGSDQLASGAKQPNFAIEDGEEISRIFMADQYGNRIDLIKGNNGWRMNDSFDVWQSRIDFLIDETITQLKIKNPVVKAAKDNVVRRMAISGIKTEIYVQGKPEPEKVYYVGGTTPDLMGTYFLLANTKEPYVLHIPGFNGYLNSRYSLKRDEWISRTVFGSTKSQIQEVHINYPSEPKSSFSVFQKEGDLSLQMEEGLQGKINVAAVKSYLNFFELLNFEGYDNSKNRSYIDSIRKTQPLAVIKLVSENRGMDELAIYAKPLDDKTKELVDKDGNPLTQDVDRYYALYNKMDRLLIVQDYTFNKVLVSYRDFLLRNQ